MFMLFGAELCSGLVKGCGRGVSLPLQGMLSAPGTLYDSGQGDMRFCDTALDYDRSSVGFGS